MAWRRFGGARGILIPSLLSGFLALWVSAAGHAQTVKPKADANKSAPTASASEAVKPTSSAPAKNSDALSILDGMADGSVEVDARGGGETQVRIAIRNNSQRRLNIVLPPGLVAASTVGQAGGFQSMGLGSIQSQPGSFGRSASNGSNAGFRSVGLNPSKTEDSISLDAGQTTQLVVPSVCLNFGLPDPKPVNKLTLMSVDEYSNSPRVRAALRSLHSIDSSQTVAQAAMWNVCNDMPFSRMRTEARRLVNPREIALAAAFVKALDRSGDSLVKSEDLTHERLFVRVNGPEKIGAGLKNQNLLGLPVSVIEPGGKNPQANLATLLVTVQLDPSVDKDGKPRKDSTPKATVQFNPGGADSWQTIGQFNLKDLPPIDSLDGAQLGKILDRQIAANFVSVRSPRKSQGGLEFKIENKLPFSVSKAVAVFGESINGGETELANLNIGPNRLGSANVKGNKVKIERVVLNGL